MKYCEDKDKSKDFKKAYISGIQNIIKKRQQEAKIIRDDYAKNIFENQEKYRDDLKKMLGWPLVNYEPSGDMKVIKEKLSDEDGYTIYRVQFEILDGLMMTGLFFKINTNEKKPLVIVQHGGLGTPELISNVYGHTDNYNDMLSRVIKNGVHAFAPQLLLWSDEYDVKFERERVDAELKRVGSSVTAIEIFGISRIIDYFEKEDYVLNFGMVGLSYGGFYTLFTTAIETRIKSAISCAFFNSRDKEGWCDWVWWKSAYMFDDAEVAALIYPRTITIEIANKDELFDYNFGVASFEKLKKMCENVGTDWVDFIVFDGCHEFCKSDEPIEKMVSQLLK